MSEIRLTCISPEAAHAVVTALTRPGDTIHNVRLDEDNALQVVISYQDIRWPMDVAEWTHENGHAHDDDASRIIVGVQTGKGVTQ